MTLERARSRKPITWLTVLGILLLPAVIGGILVAALYNPTERLDAMTTAIVNNDEPVTLDGQYVPLGRQLAAGLVEGSDDQPSNLTWRITNDADAAKGISNGTYDAVITIPENFSAAATSTAGTTAPEKATIEVTTSPDSLLVDDAITATVTDTATRMLGEQLSSTYLENVLLGFTTLGDQLGAAADGAATWAEGATEAADGVTTWAEGAEDAATGADELAGGISDLADGTSQLATGARGISSGASDLAGGVNAWASGADEAAKGLTTWASGARTVSDGVDGLANGLATAADAIKEQSVIPADQKAQLTALQNGAPQVSGALTASNDALADAAAICAAEGGSERLCGTLTQLAAGSAQLLPQTTAYVDSAAGLAGQVLDTPAQLNALASQLGEAADGASQLAGGTRDLAAGAGDASAGVNQLASGASDIADGARQLSSGATEFAGGAGELAAGARTASDGAAAFADGARQLADGATEISGGVDQLAGGATTIADGLGQAAEALPSYSDGEAQTLAAVVANPVSADADGSSLFGASAVPLLAMLALWFGGLATFVALRAIPRTVLTSRSSSAVLALRSFAPAAGIGAVQGLLVAVIVQIAASYAWSQWWPFALLSVVAGVAFAAVHQALIAVFGGAGRWVAALVGVLAIATGIVSTVPGVLASVASLMPTTPVYSALLGALTEGGGITVGLVGMIAWAFIALLVTVVVVTVRRTTTARAVLAASPA